MNLIYIIPRPSCHRLQLSSGVVGRPIAALKQNRNIISKYTGELVLLVRAVSKKSPASGGFLRPHRA